MGAVADLPVPDQGAVAALPVPSLPVDPMQADAEAFKATAGPFRQGFRSGLNSLGTAVNNLVGQTGETLGLSEFAADRFRSAEEFAATADAVGPPVRDFGHIKDMQNLVDYVAGMTGQGLASTLPAVGAGIALRRPVAGVMGVSAPLEAGEQVGNLRADPTVMTNSTPGQILANAAGKGLVNAALDATVGAEGQVARRVLKPKAQGLMETVGKAVVGEGLTEGAQNLVGQEFHKDLNPEKQTDWSAALNEAIAGSLTGGALGTGSHVAGMAPAGIATSVDELRARLGRKERPADLHGTPPLESIDDSMSAEQIADMLQEGETKAVEGMKNVWGKIKDRPAAKRFEGWENDPDKMDALNAELQNAWSESEIKPRVDEMVNTARTWKTGVQKYLENRGKQPKKSEMRTKADDDIHDALIAAMPIEYLQTISDEQLLELSGVVKNMAENPDYFEETGVPHGLRKSLGAEAFQELMETAVNAIHGPEAAPAALKKIKGAFTVSNTDMGEQLEAVEGLIRTNLRDKYKARPDMRNAALEEMAPQLLDYIQRQGQGAASTSKAFFSAMEEAFGENAPAVIKGLDEIRTKRQTTSTAAFEGGVFDDETDTEVETTDENTEAQGDERLNIKYKAPEELDRMADMEKALLDEYGRKNVRVIRNQNPDGTVSLDVVPADAAEFDERSIRRVFEDPKQNASGLENGILTVHLKSRPSGRKINLVKLTAEMIRREGSFVPDSAPAYVADMFKRGMAALVTSDEFLGFKTDLPTDADGNWAIPDETLVAVMRGKQYTFGDIKEAGKLSRWDVVGFTKEQFAKRMEEIQAERAGRGYAPLDRKKLKLEAAKQLKEQVKEAGMRKTLYDSWERQTERSGVEKVIRDGGEGNVKTRQLRRGKYEEDELTNDSRPTLESREREVGDKGRTYEEDTGVAIGTYDGPPRTTGGESKPSKPAHGKGPQSPAGMKKVAQTEQIMNALNSANPEFAAQEAKLREELRGLKKSTTGSGIKYSMMSDEIHGEVGGGGFAATHDSPIRHSGEFDWRKHGKKGEGVWAFGAGTYLSTAEGVHKSYKGRFSALGKKKPKPLLDGREMGYKSQASANASPAEHAVIAMMRQHGDKYEGEALRKVTLEHIEWNAGINEDTLLDDIRLFDALHSYRIDPGLVPDGMTSQEFEAVSDRAIVALADYITLQRDPTSGEVVGGPKKEIDIPAMRKLISFLPEGHAFYRVLNELENNRVSERENTAAVRKLDMSRFTWPTKKAFDASPTYHVSVRATQDELLDWDAPLSGQSNIPKEAIDTAVRKALKTYFDNVDDHAEVRLGTKNYTIRKWRDDYDIAIEYDNGIEVGASFEDFAKSWAGNKTGEDLYEMLTNTLGSQAKASDYLQSLGIVGHVYNAVEGRESKFRNYVIYDDSRITTNFVSFSLEDVARGRAPKGSQAAVRAYVAKVLGKDAKVFFQKMAAAGTFANLDDVETLTISTSALDPMSVGYHEALHALFARLMKADPKTARILLRAASTAPIQARLRELLKGHPKALEQLSDPEERLAYMYQFWASGHKGLLSVGPNTKTVFEKVKAFFRKLAAIWADDMVSAMAVEQANDILSAFHNGAFADRNTVAEVLHERFPEDPEVKLRRIWPGLGKFMDKAIWTATGAVRDMNIQPFTDIMDKFHTAVGDTERTPGFVQTKHVMNNKYSNRMLDIIKDLKESERRAVLEELQAGKPTSEAAKGIRALLDDLYKYMTDAGVKRFKRNSDGTVMVDKRGVPEYEDIGFVENYFPRVPNMDYLVEHKEEFLAMLAKYKVKPRIAEDIYAKYTQGIQEGNPREEDYVLGLTYFTPQANQRSLTGIPDEALAPFMEKDLVGILSQYILRATRRAEYTRRFGNSGEKIKDALAAGIKAGATPAQVNIFEDSVRAQEGSLGADINPSLKSTYGALMTYQNIRLLPLQLFSSLVDPLGIIVRGGTVGDAVNGFTRGLRELAKYKDDDAYELAKTVGSINTSLDMGLMSEMASAQYLPKLQRRINDTFFRFNGMESWNRSQRIVATVAAHDFILRHATKPNEHSARFLKELGLSDVKVTDGKLDTQDPAIQRAINQWVDEAILRPTSSLRPIYMSDPHWMLISHLKQYAYLFQKIILGRVYHELQQGNYSPAFALAGYVPTIIAADMMRVFLTPTGDDDEHRQSWTAMDWLWRGIQRAGLFGPSQFALDIQGDGGEGRVVGQSVAGPTVEQLINFVRASAQGTVGSEIVNAIPGSKLVV